MISLKAEVRLSIVCRLLQKAKKGTINHIENNLKTIICKNDI